MEKKNHHGYRMLFRVVLLGAFLLAGGCAHNGVTPGTSASSGKIKRVVVFGFRPALPEGAKPDVVRDPISGTVCRAEPVSPKAALYMTDLVFNKLVKARSYELVPPGQANGIYQTIVSTDSGVGLPPKEISRKIGAAFRADAVLEGCIYRWRERKGTDYAAERSASVAFVLLLIRPSDGTVIWRSRFDKTQKSLMENLLDASTFMKSGGRWLTAGKLASMGLDGMLKTFPGMSAKKPETPAEKPVKEGR